MLGGSSDLCYSRSLGSVASLAFCDNNNDRTLLLGWDEDAYGGPGCGRCLLETFSCKVVV